jgi:putative endonuclease
MIQNNENKLYIGITTNPKERLSYHNNNRGAAFTKNEQPFFIVFLEEYKIISEARKREIQLKKWSRNKKEKLIEFYNQRIDTRM